jgi:gliding motility-associated-like protein
MLINNRLLLKNHKAFFSLIFMLLGWFAAYTQPVNDNCSNANVITIGNGGFAMGTFTSSIIDISSATIQTGETFAPAILVAGLNQKSVWYKFTLGTTRSVRVTLAQPLPGTAIKAGDVGFTVYKANSCLPPVDSISTKLTPHALFGSTYNPCVGVGDYYVQVSSNNNANGKIYIQVDVTDSTGALYDHPKDAYDFGKLTSFCSHVDFPVECQSLEDGNEVCSSLYNYRSYTKSTWHTFTTPAYFDYVSVLIASPAGAFTNNTQQIFGINIYQGDCKLTPVSSLTSLGACDSIVTNGYYAGAKVLTCSQLQPNTTYSIQIFYKDDFDDNVRLAIAYDGTAATQGPKPISSLPATNKLGTLPPYYPGYTVTNFTDRLACNSRHSVTHCGPAITTNGVIYNGTRYDLSTFFTFQLNNAANVTINTSTPSCYPVLLVRIYNQDVTANCASLDTAGIVSQYQGNNITKCLQAGTYTVQIMGCDSFRTDYLYYGYLAGQGPLCVLSTFGSQVNASLQAVYVNAFSKYSLNINNAYDAINYSAGKMQPLTNGVAYTSQPDTFGCKNTVLPLKGTGYYCNPNVDKAIYREFTIGDANGDSKPDSGVVSVSNLFGYSNGTYVTSVLYKGDAGALAAAGNWHNYPDSIKGLKNFTQCWYSNYCYGNKVCATPGTYTLVSMGDDNHVGVANQPVIQFDIVKTQHYSGPTAQDMGSIIDTIGGQNGYVYSDKDYYSCVDNAVTIDGFAPPTDANYPATKAIYRQFYLKAASAVNICGIYYYDCNYYGGQFALFSGKASGGLGTLKYINWQFCNTATCNPLPAGWYTVVCYASGPTYQDPFQANDYSYGASVGRYSQFVINITPACPGPSYNRPYKAAVDTATNKPFLLKWGPRINSTPAYPVTDTTYNLYTENFNCTIDTPFSKMKIAGCDPSVNRVAFYVFQVARESFVQIDTKGLWAEVFALDVRKDSAQFLTTTPIQPCLQQQGYIELCRLQPGITYTLVVFAGDVNVGNGCGNVTPAVYIDQVGYSRFDHANKAYDFDVIPADSVYHDGKVGDVNPLNPGRAASSDFFYCTTGAQQTDPTEPDCSVTYNANIYNTNVNNHLFDQNTPAQPWSIEKRNLWYSFVINKPGFVHVKVVNKSPDKTFQYAFGVYKSDVDGTLPFSKVVSTGQVDSTVAQGLSLMDYNGHYGYYYYCYNIPDEIKFYRDPCSPSVADRYYVVVENINSYPYDLPGMKVNSQVEVSVLLDTVTAVPTKFDHYSTAGSIGVNLGAGNVTGPQDNFSCATQDATDPVKQQYGCAPKTLWYKFTSSVTGHLRFLSLLNGAITDYASGDMYIYRQEIPGDSTSNGLKVQPASYVYDNAISHYEGSLCISPGTYYIITTGCGRVNETFQPEIWIDEDAGDFCSAPVVAPLSGAGSNIATVTVDCHTIGGDYGEFGPTLTCPIGAKTTDYKSSWFRIDIGGKDTLDVTTYLVQNTNATSSDIQYRLMTGDCGAMQEQSCVQDALTQNTYKCLPPGSYYVQVFSPVLKNYQPVTGTIDLHLSAVVHVDTCAPLQNCLATANFATQFDCTTDDSVRFINYSTYGSSIVYKWDFGYNNKTSSAVSPAFFYPSLSNDKTYNVTLITQNTGCHRSDTVSMPVTVPARPHVNLGNDINTCNYDTTITLNATSFNGATYQWQDGSTNPTYQVPYRGQYQYSVTVTYNNCISRDTITIFVNPLQKNQAQSQLVCAADSIYLPGNSNAYYINGVYQYVSNTWNTGSTNYYIYAKDTGTYWVDNSLNGCTIRDSFLVSGGSAGFHPLGNDTSLCLLKPYTVDATVTGAYYYSWQDGTTGSQYNISAPGTYWVDIYISGCKFRDSLTVSSANPPIPLITGDTVFCAGDSALLDAGAGYVKYVWNNGDTSRVIHPQAPGNYSVTVFDAGGCSSASKNIFVSENSITQPVITGNSFLCRNDSITLDAGGGFKKYQWSTGDTTQTTKVKNAGKIFITVTNNNNCTAKDSVIVQNAPPATSKIIISTICAGSSFTLPSGLVVKSAGIYNDTVLNTAGCDSIVTKLTLLVTVPNVNDTSVAICAGQAYILPSGKTVSTTGLYNDTLHTSIGCDSIITTLHLTVTTAKTTNITASICSGQAYTLPSGKIINSAGIFNDTLHNTAGCDSIIITVNLSVLTTKTASFVKAICAGNSYTLPSGTTVNTTGIYKDTVRGVEGCDSLITTVQLTVSAPAQAVSAGAVICAGQSYTLPSGKLVNVAGVYNDTLRNAIGCDSVITTLSLTVNSPVTSNVTASVCSGNSYTLPSGAIVKKSGTFNDTLRGAAGCDSLITVLNLTVKPPLTSVTNTFVCAGQTYILPSGRVVSNAGVYKDTLTTASGCDSIITTNLTVNTAQLSSLSAAICSAQSYTLPSGIVVNTTGTYKDTIKGIAGCDSLITTVQLTVSAPAQAVSATAVICAGQSYTLPSGKVINATGVYTDTLHNAIGCDSVITTLSLTVNSVVTSNITASVCSGNSYTLPSGAVVKKSGTFNDTLRGAAGCDSLITILNLTVKPPLTSVTNAFVCAGQTYILPSGRVVNNAGVYKDTLTTAGGCDSIITTNLTVNTAKVSSLSATICSGQNYILPSGVIVNAAGVYKDTLKGTTGCDSVITTVQLTVVVPALSSVSAAICNGQLYTLPSGRKINVSGIYQDTLFTTGGCDSIITTISLTVSSVTVSSTSATICSGQVFVLPSGKSVSSTGVFNDTIHSTAGCDSIITTVNLTVTPPLTTTISAAICAGQLYTLPDGTSVNTTGVYTSKLSTAAGCDSIITVNLTVNAGTPTNIAAAICLGSTYTLPSGRVVNTAGIYSDTFNTAAGCDSIIITTLSTITPKQAASAVTICQGDSYTLPWGQVVTTAGIFNDTLKSLNGCDSIITSVRAIVNSKPVVTLTKSNDIDCILGTAKLTAEGGATYLWQPPGSLDNPNIFNPVASPSVTTVYHVTVSEGGCSAEDSIEVQVVNNGAVNGFLVPSAFTPNNDGVNDCFGVKSWGHISDLNFYVFDRWGLLLFHTTDPSKCWDGTYKGALLKSGTYVYQVSANTNCGFVYRKGTVVLIR